ncbi:hypothetical protein [Chrysiogenes arsenatis]|nr:hypothetical protein [Chrysiogenes arsenatis]
MMRPCVTNRGSIGAAGAEIVIATAQMTKKVNHTFPLPLNLIYLSC